MTKRENKITEEYITKYKQLEKVLSESDLQERSVYEYTNTLSESDQKRLNLCRSVRNFLQHEDDIFIYPTEQMIEFLDSIILSIKRTSSYAKDVMKRVTPLTEKDKIEEAAKKLNRYPFIPIVDTNKNLIGVITDSEIRKAVSLGLSKKKIKDITLNTSIKTISKDEPANEIEGNAIVTDTGKKNGKYLGVII